MRLHSKWTCRDNHNSCNCLGLHLNNACPMQTQCQSWQKRGVVAIVRKMEYYNRDAMVGVACTHTHIHVHMCVRSVCLCLPIKRFNKCLVNNSTEDLLAYIHTYENVHLVVVKVKQAYSQNSINRIILNGFTVARILYPSTNYCQLKRNAILFLYNDIQQKN